MPTIRYSFAKWNFTTLTKLGKTPLQLCNFLHKRKSLFAFTTSTPVDLYYILKCLNATSGSNNMFFILSPFHMNGSMRSACQFFRFGPSIYPYWLVDVSRLVPIYTHLPPIRPLKTNGRRPPTLSKCLGGQSDVNEQAEMSTVHKLRGHEPIICPLYSDQQGISRQILSWSNRSPPCVKWALDPNF